MYSVKNIGCHIHGRLCGCCLTYRVPRGTTDAIKADYALKRAAFRLTLSATIQLMSDLFNAQAVGDRGAAYGHVTAEQIAAFLAEQRAAVDAVDVEAGVVDASAEFKDDAPPGMYA